jgi:hypothetical protein
MKGKRKTGNERVPRKNVITDESEVVKQKKLKIKEASKFKS